MTAVAPSTSKSSILTSRLGAWPHKAPKIGPEGNNLLLQLRRKPMSKLAINRLGARALLGPCIHPNGFVKAMPGQMYEITPAGSRYLDMLEAAGLLE